MIIDIDWAHKLNLFGQAYKMPAQETKQITNMNNLMHLYEHKITWLKN